jgi:uncharacterized protein (DUF488 family)
MKPRSSRTTTSRHQSWQGIRVFTIGHSTRTLDELVAMLQSFDITVLADIRTIPRSRHNPQFNADALATALPALGLRYVHFKGLGGLRKPLTDSPNQGWRNTSFRGYADYMATDDFELALAQLHELAGAGRVVIMCAEAVQWRCHRSLVADALVARGAHVEHISALSRSRPHRMTPFAKVRGERVTYPSESGASH